MIPYWIIIPCPIVTAMACHGTWHWPWRSQWPVAGTMPSSCSSYLRRWCLVVPMGAFPVASPRGAARRLQPGGSTNQILKRINNSTWSCFFLDMINEKITGYCNSLNSGERLGKWWPKLIMVYQGLPNLQKIHHWGWLMNHLLLGVHCSGVG